MWYNLTSPQVARSRTLYSFQDANRRHCKRRKACTRWRSSFPRHWQADTIPWSRRFRAHSRPQLRCLQSNNKMRFMRMLLRSIWLCVLAFAPLSAQTLTVLASFNGANLSYPSGLIQATDGNFRSEEHTSEL